MSNKFEDGSRYVLSVRRYVWNIDGVVNMNLYAGTNTIEAIWHENKKEFDPYVKLDDIVKFSKC
jgi:hypothetical protein